MFFFYKRSCRVWKPCVFDFRGVPVTGWMIRGLQATEPLMCDSQSNICSLFCFYFNTSLLVLSFCRMKLTCWMEKASILRSILWNTQMITRYFWIWYRLMLPRIPKRPVSTNLMDLLRENQSCELEINFLDKIVYKKWFTVWK